MADNLLSSSHQSWKLLTFPSDVLSNIVDRLPLISVLLLLETGDKRLSSCLRSFRTHLHLVRSQNRPQHFPIDFLSSWSGLVKLKLVFAEAHPLEYTYGLQLDHFPSTLHSLKLTVSKVAILDQLFTDTAHLSSLARLSILIFDRKNSVGRSFVARLGRFIQRSPLQSLVTTQQNQQFDEILLYLPPTLTELRTGINSLPSVPFVLPQHLSILELTISFPWDLMRPFLPASITELKLSCTTAAQLDSVWKGLPPTLETLRSSHAPTLTRDIALSLPRTLTYLSVFRTAFDGDAFATLPRGLKLFEANECSSPSLLKLSELPSSLTSLDARLRIERSEWKHLPRGLNHFPMSFPIFPSDVSYVPFLPPALKVLRFSGVSLDLLNAIPGKDAKEMINIVPRTPVPDDVFPALAAYTSLDYLSITYPTSPDVLKYIQAPIEQLTLYLSCSPEAASSVLPTICLPDSCHRTLKRLVILAIGSSEVHDEPTTSINAMLSSTLITSWMSSLPSTLNALELTLVIDPEVLAALPPTCSSLQCQFSFPSFSVSKLKYLPDTLESLTVAIMDGKNKILKTSVNEMADSLPRELLALELSKVSIMDIEEDAQTVPAALMPLFAKCPFICFFLTPNDKLNSNFQTALKALRAGNLTVSTP